MESSNRGDTYSRITADIIAAIEARAGKFRMPWHHDGSSTSHPTNVASGKPYRGVNTLALWAAAARGGYADGLGEPISNGVGRARRCVAASVAP